MKVVSLDGHRISIRKIELKDSYAPKKVIVPGKTLQEISKIIGGEAEADVDISFTKNHIVFEFDRTIVSIKTDRRRIFPYRSDALKRL